jgi:linoleoyl-CoA desaturase
MNTVKPFAPLSYLTEQDTLFHKALMKAAYQYLQEHHDHRYANKFTFIKTGIALLLCIFSYVFCLHQTNILTFIGYYFVFMSMAMFLNINVLHDASHNIFFKSRRANRIACRIVTLPLGIDPDYWRVRHVEYHHVYPNIEHYDLDSEENGFIRQMPFQEWLPHMQYQAYYWPIIAALSLPYIAWIFDWSDRLNKTPLAYKKILHGWSGWLLFLLSKLLHFLIVLIIPILCLTTYGISWKIIVCTYLITQMISSLVVVFLLLGTHWANTEFYQAPNNGKMLHGWYFHNFSTACDWEPSPKKMNTLFGGLNFHLTHHLFPNWSHRHYPALAKIIEELAPHYNLSYRCIGYFKLINEQYVFLKEMGKKP